MNPANRIITFIITLFLITTIAGCSTLRHSKPGTTTTIILTRHADRNFMAEDLNEKGIKRAAALVKATSEMKITAVYCPDKKRNRDTANPTAKQFGLKTTIVDSSPNSRKMVTTFLTKHSGGTILWVGNTSNLPDIYEILGGEGEGPVLYGDLFVLNIKDKGKPEVKKIRYGPK